MYNPCDIIKVNEQLYLVAVVHADDAITAFPFDEENDEQFFGRQELSAAEVIAKAKKIELKEGQLWQRRDGKRTKIEKTRKYTASTAGFSAPLNSWIEMTYVE